MDKMKDIAARDSGQAFTVEQNGINIIPQSERRGRPSDLFGIWAATNVILTYIIVSSLLVSMGLTVGQMLAVVIAGYSVYWLVGYASIPGTRAGTVTLIISRGIFGSRGNIVPSLFSWLTNVGWEAVNLVLASFALFSLCQQFGFNPSTAEKGFLVLGLAVITFGVGILGHATIMLMQNVLTWILGAVMLGLIPQVYTAATATPLAPVVGADISTLMIALSLTIAMPLSYVNGAANFARYLPADTRGSSIAFWTFLGGIIPATVITVIGYFAARLADLTDPVAGLEPLLAAWYFKLYIVLVIGGAIANNFINNYSSSMSLLAMGLKVSRPTAVVVDAVLATSAAAFAIFFYDFINAFVAFLALMVIWIAPWFGVFVVDTLVRKGRYDDAATMTDMRPDAAIEKWGRQAYISWLVGIVAALACTSTEVFVSPFAQTVLGGANLSIIVGFLASAGLYWFLRGRAVVGA